MKLKNILFYILVCTVISLGCGDDEPSAGTCSDGIMNNNETGIDCGGDCTTVCPTCTDGVQNGNEEGVDCGGDCSACVVETTVAEDKANIDQAMDDMLQCVFDLKKSRTADVLLRNFLNLSNGEAFNEQWIEDITDDLEDVIDLDYIEDNNRFSMNVYSGSYIFNHTDNSWLKINDTPDKVTFRFPSDPSLTTNNVELVLDQYTDQQATIDGDVYYLPSQMHAYMNVDDSKIFEINLTKVTYASNADFEIPVEIEATIFIDPLNISVSVTRESLTDFKVDITLDDNALCNISIQADVSLKDDDLENLNEDGFDKINITVRAGSISFQSLAGIAELISLDDPSESVINSLLDLDVLFNGVKIADLEYDDDNETMIIFYKDQSFEDSNTYYDDFLSELESLLFEFLGEW